MPKVSKLQPNFSAGEISPLVYGRVDAQRYKAALTTCLNYLPTLQGPLIRRPGTKFVANVKDSNNPPFLIPFQFSATQAYMLELGNNYMRFYSPSGQIVTSSTVFKVSGTMGFNGALFTQLTYNATRPSQYSASVNESVTASSVLATGAILELTTPYAIADIPKIKWAQTADTVYLVHPSYAPYKLQRKGNEWWDLKPVIFQDGPYLPLNSYDQIGDNTNVLLTPSTIGLPTLSTGPSYSVWGTGIGAINNWLRITTNTSHVFVTGQKLFIQAVSGTVEANNGTSSIAASYWTIDTSTCAANQLDLVGGTFVNGLTGSSGTVSPALFQMTAAPNTWADAQTNKLRTFAIYEGGVRYWGVITGITNAATAQGAMYVNLASASQQNTWQLGTWSAKNGYPAAVCFHQNRLMLAGCPAFPLELDGSQSGNYEGFAASNSSLVVSDSYALQFPLISAELNALKWLKSAPQGLLAGSITAEWHVAPSTQSAALTPTNVNAVQTANYGSADVDAVQIGNGTLYVNRTSRKVREMNYVFQIGSFRSTDLTELAEHLAIPGIIKLAVQKETQPILWAINSSGVLLSMIYNRDDLSLQAGWASHRLGGQSDSGGTPPKVVSMGVIPTQNASFDQLWLVVNRWINSSSQVTIEYLTKPFDDTIRQDDASHLDCGFTYDSPVAITNIVTGSSAQVTAAAHGFNTGSSVKIVGVVGMNILNSSIVVGNQVNELVFKVGSAVTNSFYLLDLTTNVPLNTNSSSVYVSGGQARKLVNSVSGLTLLENETVGVLADGGIHPDIVVASSGVATLAFPASKVQFGYRYNSDGATLTSAEGSAQGSAIGSMRRINRFAFLLHNIGDLQVGSNFNNLISQSFQQADQQLADTAVPLFSGMIQDGVESIYDLTDTLCFRQNSALPGMVQSLTLFLEESDV